MNIKEKFCCEDMESCVNNKDWVIEYSPACRDYLLSCRDQITLRMKYCFFCGAKLPRDLNDERHDILVEELGIKSPDYGNNDPRIPDEFKTDEWWKKRGLQRLSKEKLYKDAEQELNNKKIWWTKDKAGREKIYKDPLNQKWGNKEIWLSKDNAGHGGAAHKVYVEGSKSFEKVGQLDASGKVMNKHMGEIGNEINIKDIIWIKR